MRQETQRYNDVTVRLEVVNAGVGVIGLTPSATLQRVSDGQWYDGVGNFTSATPVTLPMSPLAGIDGAYAYSPAVGALSTPALAASMGYYFTVYDAAQLAYETGHITVIESGGTAADIWAYDLDDFGAAANTAGARLRNASEAVALGDGTTRSPLHLATAPQPAPSGKLYTTTVAASVGATAAYAGRRAILYQQATTRSYPCVINSVANDGNDYFQLAREDGGTWAIAIAVGDRLIVATDLHHSFDASAVWSTASSGFTVPGTFGESFRRMLALRQENMRVVYSAWNEVNVPTAGVVYIYDSKIAMDADAGGTGIGAFGSYVFDATFDGTPAIKPTEYTSGKTL